MNKFLFSALLLSFIFFTHSPSASSVEPANLFIIKDIQYQSFQDGIKLAIILNDHIEHISYELENPYRIIIDPLEDVYCDYQDKVYFDEGLIKSIEFIKNGKENESQDEAYYAFDFVSIELREPVAYKILKDGPNILLDVGENRPPTVPKENPGEKEAKDKEADFMAELAKAKEGVRSPLLTSLDKSTNVKSGDLTPILTKELSFEECVQVAVANHLPLKIAEEQVKLARLKVNESFREMLPVASLLWQESSGRIDDERYRGRKYGFEFKQPLFRGGELYFTWEQAKTNLNIAGENYDKVKEELVHEVSRAYYNLAKALNNLDMQKELFGDIKSDLELAQREYDLGLSTQLEFLNAQSSYDQVYYSIASGENDVSLKRLALTKIMNIDISIEIKIDYRLEMKEFNIDMEECIGLAMSHRAELRTRRLMVKSTKLGELIAKSQLWPQMDVVGKYVKSAEELEPRALGWNLQNERFLGVTASLPLSSHTVEALHKRGKLAPTVTTFESNTEYNIDLYKITPFDDLGRLTKTKDAGILHKQALFDLTDTERRIHAEVREAFYDYKEAQIKFSGAINNLKLYEKELMAAQVKKDLAEATVSEVMDAKIKFYGERANYINAVGDIYLAVASLNKAIGMGGYFK